ncbi:MAG: NAD(P)/FAD-dependent oxidoreductase [Candidatus Bipolaricaulaceae bacterium]
MRISVDVAVVGGGAAGMAAAKAAAEAGAKTLLLEREERLGGVLDQCIHPGFGLHRYREELTGPEFSYRLLSELARTSAEVLSGTTVLSVQPGPELLCANQKGLLRVQAKALVWAGGARERPFGPLLIPGTRPAGIFTAGLAQKLVNIHGLLPGRRALILGSGDIGLIMARRLHLEGVEVVGVAEIRPFPGGLLRNVAQCLEDFGIPLFLRHTVAQVHGRKRLSGVTLVEVDERGQLLPGTEKFFSVDTLVLSVGLIPELRPVEHFLVWDHSRRWPWVNSFWQTAAPWLFLAGNSLTVFDLVDTVARVGEETGRNAARYALGDLPPVSTLPLRGGENVAVLVPQACIPGEPVSLFLRVPKPMDQAVIRVGGVYEKNHKYLRPAEMVEIKLPAEATTALAGKNEALVEVCPQ